jgi:peptide subunit release factor 1 (eRF1)
MNFLKEGIIFEKLKKGELSASFIYHTYRDLPNKEGKDTGSIRVLVLKDNMARVEYLCPECEHHGYVEQEWKRPFAVKCEKCGLRITVPKLKDQVKKKKN